MRVLALLTTDLTLRMIGARLFLSLNTIRTHRRAIYRKLGATSRRQAVARAQALGLLDLTEPADLARFGVDHAAQRGGSHSVRSILTRWPCIGEMPARNHKNRR
jgi:DNA-binding CsgD family transcriptional regulator